MGFVELVGLRKFYKLFFGSQAVFVYFNDLFEDEVCFRGLAYFSVEDGQSEEVFRRFLVENELLHEDVEGSFVVAI